MEKYLSAIKNIWFPPQRSWRVKVWCWKISAYISQHPHILTIARSRTRDDSGDIYTYLQLDIYNPISTQSEVSPGEHWVWVLRKAIAGIVCNHIRVCLLCQQCQYIFCSRNMQQRLGIQSRATPSLLRNWAVLNVSTNYSCFPPSTSTIATKNVQFPDERMVKLTKETEQLKYFWYFMVAQFLRLG